MGTMQLAMVSLNSGFFDAEEEWFAAVVGYVNYPSPDYVKVSASENGEPAMWIPVRNVSVIHTGPPIKVKKFYDLRPTAE